MLDPSSAPFLFTLFYFTEKAIGYAGGNVAGALAKPLTEAIEEKARWLSGTDDTGKRWAAFAEAYDETMPRFAESAPNRPAALSVRQAFQGLDLKTGKGFEELSGVAAQLEKTPILSEDLNDGDIEDFCMASLRAEGRTTPPRVEVVDAVQAFIAAFQGRLFEQPDYREWMLQGAQWKQYRPPRHDTRDRLLAQLIERHQDLDFVGIPDRN